MSGRQIIEADLTWTGGAFERGVRIAVNDGGRIEAVGDVAGEPDVRLPGRAILPGMINAHSHAFQRGLRGRGETFASAAAGHGGPDDFWSWREEMYRLVEELDERRMLDLCLQAFREMRAAGIATVGEFHYLHHSLGARDYAMDEVVLGAAKEAGVRIALLQAFYHTGGIGRDGPAPLSGGQKRFGSGSLNEYWRQMDRLSELIDPATQSLGVVAHSIRAVPIEMIAELHEEADRRGLPFHMHVEEQPREIEESLQCYGRTPMALLNQQVRINPLFTAVHCTHTAPADMDDYLSAGGNVCICPLTEANLGDGAANVPWIIRNDGHICLGTDSNTRICMAEEMRCLEYGQRLATQSRGVCRDEHGSCAGKLFEMATINGARSLGLKAGAIRPGLIADFITLDLDAPSLAGWTEETLLEAFVFGGNGAAIAETCVGGHWSLSRSAPATAGRRT